MNLKIVFSSLILAALPLVALSAPAHAGFWDRVQDTVGDVIDPGGIIEESAGTVWGATEDAADSVTEYATYNVRIENRATQPVAFEVGFNSFSLEPGYYADIQATEGSNFSMYNAIRDDLITEGQSVIRYSLDDGGVYYIDVGFDAQFYDLYQQ